MGAALLIVLGLSVALYRRSAVGTSILGSALVGLLVAFGVWASFFGSIFALAVFQLGMSALLAAAALALGLESRTRSWPRVPPYLGTFAKWVCGALLLYSVVPIAFVVWFLVRIFEGEAAPGPSQTLLLVAQPLALVTLCGTALTVSMRSTPPVDPGAAATPQRGS